jgi:hypothetical protein
MTLWGFESDFSCPFCYRRPFSICYFLSSVILSVLSLIRGLSWNVLLMLFTFIFPPLSCHCLSSFWGTFFHRCLSPCCPSLPVVLCSPSLCFFLVLYRLSLSFQFLSPTRQPVKCNTLSLIQFGSHSPLYLKTQPNHTLQPSHLWPRSPTSSISASSMPRSLTCPST